MMWHILVMPSVNMRELRDTRRLKAWLKAGKTVELRDRDRVIGRIVPERAKDAPVEWPDFAARAKAILRGRRVSGADLLIEEREK
jgi:antitoxin (DNA-binding transcriptional repressor) of toxin-antitoxin stability system